MRRILTAASAALLLCACGSDRAAGGTTGTEAGNALAVVFALPDGRPAAGARVVARPSLSVDSSDASSWRTSEADASGRARLLLPDGEWTLEARSGGFALVSYLTVAGDTTVDATLFATRPLTATVVDGATGTVSLPGLGVSVRTGSDGIARFDALPEQALRVSVDAGASEALVAGSSVALSLSDPASACLDPVRLRVAGDGIPSPRLLADSLLPDSDAVLLDTLGAFHELLPASASSGDRRTWSRVPEGLSSVFLCRRVSGVAPTEPVFAPGGALLEIVPDLDSALGDLSGSAGSFASSATAAVDPLWGRTLDASLGGVVGSIRAGLPDTGAFAVAFLARFLATGVESIRLLDWGASDGSGLRVDVGGGRLALIAPGVDTAIAWDPGTSWFGLSVGWDRGFLAVATDGVVRLRVQASIPEGRAAWSRREVGRGGGIRVARLTVRGGTLDLGPLSRIPGGFAAWK